jgi:hypothetical protein
LKMARYSRAITKTDGALEHCRRAVFASIYASWDHRD